jgi:hypothetical protein
MTAFGASTAAATGGITFLIGALALVAMVVAKHVKTIKENSPEKQLERINALLEKQEEIIAEAESKAKEARKTLDNTEELKNKYEELSNKIILTEEE